MQSASEPPNEQARLAALNASGLLDDLPDAVLDAVVHAASVICGVPMATITLITGDRQVFKSKIGLRSNGGERSSAFCAHTILSTELFVVENAATDHRFADNPLVVGEPHIRFYAGAPLRDVDGHALGSLCVLDSTPRQLSAREREVLLQLSRVVIRSFEAIAQRKSAERRAVESARRLQLISDHLPALVAHVDVNEQFTFCNARYRAIYGRDPHSLLGTNVKDLQTPEVYAHAQPHIREALAGRTEHFEGQANIHGELRDYSSVYTPDIDLDGRVAGFFVMTHDITHQKQAERKLRDQATRDSLTGLANRFRLRETFSSALARALRSKQKLALMYLDLDRFKAINDRFGHAGGDHALIAFAERLRANVRGSDLVVRLAGDEFVILLEQLREEAEARRVADKIIAALRKPLLLGDQHIQLGTSIGIALYPDHGDDLDELLHLADAAMYSAKLDGRGKCRMSP